MNLCRQTIWVLFVALVPCLAAHSSDKVLPLQFTRVELADGRILNDVTIRSYDAKSEKLLVVTRGKAMTIPIALFPSSLTERLKSAPASGGTVSTIAKAPARPLGSAADQYGTVTAVPVTPPPRPAVIAREAPGSASPDSVPEVSLIRHQFAARAHATRYYRYEYQAGSNSIRVTALDFEFNSPEPVPGWSGRCRTEGKAFLEFFDSKGRSFQRATSTFEVVTEQKPGEGVRVVDFSRKT